MADPQTLYFASSETGKPLPKIRVAWDGAGTLTPGSPLCFDLSNGAETVTKPVTADLGAFAGVYVGNQGSSITGAQFIDIVPSGGHPIVVEVNAAADVYAVNDAIALANDSWNVIIPQDSGDVEGLIAGRAVLGFIGLCLTAETLAAPGKIKVLLRS